MPTNSGPTPEHRGIELPPAEYLTQEQWRALAIELQKSLSGLTSKYLQLYHGQPSVKRQQGAWARKLSNTPKQPGRPSTKRRLYGLLSPQLWRKPRGKAGRPAKWGKAQLLAFLEAFEVAKTEMERDCTRKLKDKEVLDKVRRKVADHKGVNSYSRDIPSLKTLQNLLAAARQHQR